MHTDSLRRKAGPVVTMRGMPNLMMVGTPHGATTMGLKTESPSIRTLTVKLTGTLLGVEAQAIKILPIIDSKRSGVSTIETMKGTTITLEVSDFLLLVSNINFRSPANKKPR